jgi:hypothetical protein
LKKKGNCPGSRREAKASGGKACFFEKKQQKTFGCFDFGAAGDAQPRGSNVFRFIFSKKHRFLPLSSLRPISLSYLGSYKKRQ